MSREENRWEKASISYENYLRYVSRKQDRFELSLIDLLFVSNFKGGNAAIHEPDVTVNQKLQRYSTLMRQIHREFGGRMLRNLTTQEIATLKNRANQFVDLTTARGANSIDGFKSSYASALLHFHFPDLVPILDRRVLNGAGIAVEVNREGQVIRIERYFPALVDKFHLELQKRPNLTIRTLDKKYFVIPIL